MKEILCIKAHVKVCMNSRNEVFSVGTHIWTTAQDNLGQNSLLLCLYPKWGFGNKGYLWSFILCFLFACFLFNLSCVSMLAPTTSKIKRLAWEGPGHSNPWYFCRQGWGVSSIFLQDLLRLATRFLSWWNPSKDFFTTLNQDPGEVLYLATSLMRDS